MYTHMYIYMCIYIYICIMCPAPDGGPRRYARTRGFGGTRGSFPIGFISKLGSFLIGLNSNRIPS